MPHVENACIERTYKKGWRLPEDVSESKKIELRD